MLRLLRGLLGALWKFGLLVLAIAISAIVSTRLPVARRVTAAFVSDLASREMKGGLNIGNFSRLSADAISARNLVLFDEQGRRVVEADRLVLKLDLAALWRGQLRFRQARLDHAKARLFDDGTGLPTLLSAFDSPTPSNEKSSKNSKPLHVEVDGIRIDHLDLSGELLGLQNLRALDIHAGGKMVIDRFVHVKIDYAAGAVVQPFAFIGHVDSLHGTISTVESEGVLLLARTHRDGERANATVRYASGWFGLEVDADQLTASTLRGLGYDWMPEISTPLSGHMSLAGPLDPVALHLKAELTTQAGPATLEGDIDAQSGVFVTIRSDGIELRRLFADYPPVHARGLVRIESKKDELTPRLHLEIQPLLYSSIAVPGFTLDGALTDTGLRIDRIDAQSKGGRITGRGRIEKNGVFQLALRATFNDIANDANLRRVWPDAHARLNADLRVASAKLGQGQFNFDGHITLGDLRYGLTSAKLLDLRGSAHGDPEQPRLDIAVTGSEVRLGAYLLGDPSLHVTGGPHTYTADGQFVAAGKRTFNISAKLAASEQGFVVDADPIELTVGESSWRGALQALRVSDDAIELELLRLASRAQRMEARGVLRFHGDDQIDAQLQDFDVAAVRALVGERFPLREGRADTRVELRGDIARPDLHVQGALRDGVVGNLTGVNALYLATYKGGALEIDGELDLGERGLVDLNGGGELDQRIENPIEALRRGRYDLKFESQGLALSLLPAIKRAGVSGAVSGSLRFTGTLDNPGFETSLAVDTLTLPGCIPLSVLADTSFEHGSVKSRIAVADDRGQLTTADAKLQLDWHTALEQPESITKMLLRGPWQITGQVSERRLDQLPGPIGRALPYPVALSADFEFHKANAPIAGVVRFDGHVAEPIAGARCATQVQPVVRGSVDLSNDASRFWFELGNGKEALARLDGTLDTPVDRWAESGQFERPQALHAAANVKLTKMEEVPYACEYGRGTLDAQASLDGGLSGDPSLLVRIDSSFLPLTMTEDHRKQLSAPSCEGDPMRAHFELRADKDSLKGSGNMQGCHGGATELEASMKMSWERLVVLPLLDKSAPMEAHVRLDGSQLRPLIDRIPGVKNGDVIAYGEIDVSGTPAQPRFAGQLNLSNGRLYLVSMGQEIDALSARFTLLGDWAKLEHLQAEAGSGRIEASGGLGFSGLWPDHARVAVLATKLPIKREGIDIAWVTGSAAIDAKITTEYTHAALQLQTLDITLPDTSNRELQPLEPNADVTIVTEKAALPEKPYAIEFAVEGKRRLSVRRNDFNATIATELAISYRDPTLQVGGYISFGSGEFEIFGKRFTINNGALRFDPEREFDPDVFLLATQKPEAAGVSPVTLTVTGTLNDPHVTFSSDVCPGETAAITYLVSGQCVASDSDLALETTQTQAAFASGLVGGILTLGAQKQLKGLVPRFSVESTTSGSSKVKAGFSSESLVPKFMRRLVRRVYVEGGVYTPRNDPSLGPVESGTSTTLQFLLELYFPYNLVGSGRVAPQNWGVDLLWEP